MDVIFKDIMNHVTLRTFNTEGVHLVEENTFNASEAFLAVKILKVWNATG